jgi:hypothetical protein
MAEEKLRRLASLSTDHDAEYLLSAEGQDRACCFSIQFAVKWPLLKLLKRSVKKR